MTRKQLEYFLKTAETLNITKAAKELFISQPSLSEQLKKLENELGVELFIRKNKTLKLTLAGKILIGETYELFAKERELIDAVRTAGIISRRQLNIHYIQGPLTEEMPKMINAFHRKNPDIMLNLADISWNEMTDELPSNNYDVAFYLRISDYDIPGTEHIDLIRAEACIAVSDNHPLACLDEITFEDIRYQTFVLDIKPSQNNFGIYSLHEIFKKHGASKPNILPAKNMDICLLNIRSGVAIGVVSPAFVASSQTNIRYIPFKELGYTTLSLYWSQKNHNPLITGFTEFMKENYSRFE